MLLGQAEYYVKAMYSTSEELYGNLLSAVYDILQRDGASPEIWIATSLVLIEIYNNKFMTVGIPNLTKIQ